MARIEPINPKDARRIKRKIFLESVQAQFGKAPKIFKTMADFPVALNGFLQLQGTLAGVVLPEPFQEQYPLCF
jgi:hypothetical protein